MLFEAPGTQQARCSYSPLSGDVLLYVAYWHTAAQVLAASPDPSVHLLGVPDPCHLPVEHTSVTLSRSLLASHFSDGRMSTEGAILAGSQSHAG